MDDKEFQDFLKSIGGLKTTATNQDTSVKRGAFGLPMIETPKTEPAKTSLTDSPTGRLPVIKQLTQYGTTFGATVGAGALSLGKFGLKLAQGAGNLAGIPSGALNPIMEQMDVIKKALFEDPYQKEFSSGFGKAGQFSGDVALFSAGNKPIVGGQQFLGGVSKGLGVESKVGNYLLKKGSQIIPEAIGMGGIQYALSGDKKEATTVGIASGILSGITHVGADAFRTLIPQTVKEAVAKVFVPRGKIKLSGTENITDDAVGAMTTIKNLSPEIKVVDADGVSKNFVPEEATLLEMPQALSQAKEKVYNAYTELAEKAGDKGVSFGQADFNQIISNLSKYEGRGYLPSFSNKARQIQEALNRFGTQNPKDGLFYFENTSPKDIQVLIEAINRDVNPLSDKAGAEVALDVSRQLRELLDTKIANATGGEYQGLRDAYAQLKSIEPTIVAEFKKALRGQGVQADIIDKIATVDMITGVLSGNPIKIIKGTAWEAVKIAWKKALGKEANLQRAFKLLSEAEKETPALAQRIYSNPAETELFKMGEKAGESVKNIKNIPNKEGGFISVGGETPKSIPVENAPKGTQINVGMNRGTTAEKMTEEQITSPLPKDVKVLGKKIIKGDTEDSLALELSRPLTPDEMTTYLKATDQKAIPQLTDGKGTMYGSNEWGDFNGEYFYDAKSGKTLNQLKPNVNPELPTLKTLNKLEGRDSVSKQFISDLTNSGEIKQQERDVIRQVLSQYPDGKINVPEFTNKVQNELLPLTVKDSDLYKASRKSAGYFGNEMAK
jgi:hypothetical protein